MFTRIAIVNRGEAARRLIHAVREINAARVGSAPIRTIALHTTGERQATFVREADEAYDIGPAAERPYLNLGVLEQALRATGAEAAWVGWGFVAEDPAFAELCDKIGVTFIGPAAEAMRRLGDKIGAKLLAEEVGVPVAPWSRGPVETLEAAIAAADTIGYPLMLKATAGGGGRGIRLVASAADLTDAYERTSQEALRAFGSGIVFLEKVVTGARHVEVQVIADGQGTAWALGVRDCSIQRRNQKIIEESASPVLEPDQVRELKESAERLANAVGYRGACTVEFLYHPGEKYFAFLEVNTRLQVEHPITEAVTGTDLVKLQISVASGEKLTGERPVERGHAVEARLNAEDPDRDFAPAPGRIALLRFPAGPGIRVDTGVTEGDVIPPDFDSMIAKIIAVGANRDEALARLRRAVAETTVLVEGGATNKSFVLTLLDEPAVIDGSADTQWVDRMRDNGGLTGVRHAAIALATAAIDSYAESETAERNRLWESGRGGRPHVRHEVGRGIDLKLGDRGYRVVVARTGAAGYRVRIHDQDDVLEFTAEVARIDAFHSRITVGDNTFRVVSATHGPVHLVEVGGVAHRVSRDEGGVIRALAPGLVVATPLAEGDEVEAGAPVLVLESMKMETVLRAPFPARLRELSVAVGSQVDAGAALARLEPLGEAEAAGDEAAPSELVLPAGAASDRAPGIEALRAQLLGYDSFDGTADTVLARYLGGREKALAFTPGARAAELELGELIADVLELAVPAAQGRSDEPGIRSLREQFHIYLQALDPERDGLTDGFRRTLGRVLAYYGVESTERTPALEEAVFRIFLSLGRHKRAVDLGSVLLRLWQTEAGPELPADVTRDMLDRLILVSENSSPALADLARSVLYRWFVRPETSAAREVVHELVAEQLRSLDDETSESVRSERIRRLADIPEAVEDFLADRIAGAGPREPMLEVAARWHYGRQRLGSMRATDAAGRPVVVCDYQLELRPGHPVPTTAVITVGKAEEVTAGSPLVETLIAELSAAPATQVKVVDLYLSWPDAPGAAQERADRLARLLTEAGLQRHARRIVVGMTTGAGDLDYYTFRHDGSGGLTEDRLIRSVHPLAGRHLSLWRLSAFHITRIETPESLLLYHCVAKADSGDQRLVALAQVSRFDITHDAEGRIIEVAGVDTVLNACLEAIGRARYELDPTGRTLDSNHVWLDIRPTTQVKAEQIAEWQRTTAPRVAHAGVEEILLQGRVLGDDRREHNLVARLSYEPGGGVAVSVEKPAAEPLAPLDDYGRAVLRARRRNTVHPFEIVRLLTGPNGSFTEFDLPAAELSATGPIPALVPVQRTWGRNTSAMVVGIVATPTELHPEGIRRVLLAGDPTKSLGALSEQECARVTAAIDLAAREGLPVEWFALSSGARIAMDSGTENMDWVARALKRIVEFTQDGGEIDIVVTGINVGAQPYWNAEATMLMHTKGILVMTPASAMVLTGKQALDFSGGVSAEDNFGIGGYARVMGPNGQAQYWAPNLAGARDILLKHYDFTYVAAGEQGPRRAVSSDPVDRDVTVYPHVHPDSDFTTVGDIFSATANPDRKKAFDIRTVMRAVADLDQPMLERWADMADAGTAVTVDARIGGAPVSLIGIESRPVPRHGFPPADGPDIYTAGTLFPRSAKKVARALNAASGNRPAVVLANLSGFDGSPDSMRTLQLEYGAEIGRAIVNFDGPIVFCVISRYHGGAFVVFSKALNENMTVLAVEGSFASVIGGAPAAAVVFTREVDVRVAADARVRDLEQRLAQADDSERLKLRGELADVRQAVRAEQVSALASEFDGIHSIERAVEVGSVDAVIAATELRPAIAKALGGRQG
ncbi:ATP-binding protein [Nocardia stercoris]|uniref:biotin carboxylase n=1 Tax=Nocardia stercoris TaxID=2483361 RepID=A0A3M2LFK3_9NOCA|nr:carboxyl transferase domain-containing protein [Nocardia stercoris]RMI35363.1 ATP-grasp domain-containing protein [Nocardia stercoris]